MNFNLGIGTTKKIKVPKEWIERTKRIGDEKN